MEKLKMLMRQHTAALHTIEIFGSSEHIVLEAQRPRVPEDGHNPRLPIRGFTLETSVSTSLEVDQALSIAAGLLQAAFLQLDEDQVVEAVERMLAQVEAP